MTLVTLYGRTGCCLCDEARDALLAMRADGAGFELVEVDIEGSEELHRTYLERIPVVEVDGEEISELILDADAVRGRLSRVTA